MAYIELTKVPRDVSLTGSPISFKASTNLYGQQSNLKIICRIECLLGSSFTPVGTITKAPGNSGECEFDISELLKPEISSSFVYPNGTFAAIQHNNLRIYRVAFYESYYNAGSIIYTSELYSNELIALNGGTSDEMLAQMNDYGTSFYAEWLQKGKFLTHMPRTMDVAPSGHPIHLSFLCLSGMGTTLRLSVETKQGASSWEDYGTSYPIPAEPGKIYEFNVGTDFLNINAADDKYRIFIKNESGEQVSEIFTFNIDRDTYQRNTFFLFKNSLNAYDTLWCKGLLNRSVNIDRKTVTRARSTSISGSDPTRIIQRTTRERMYNINTGIVKQADLYAWMEEFFASDRLYLIEDGYAWNIILESSTYNGDNDFRQPRGIAFSYTKGFVEQYFGSKLSEIGSELVGGDFNFDFNEDYNIGDNDGDNTTPPADTINSVEYRCVVDVNGVNTGVQERRYLFNDGTGGTYYGEWVAVGSNYEACPLPPTQVSLEIVEETDTTFKFRAVVDRNTATSDYTVYLNRTVNKPPNYSNLNMDDVLSYCPASLVIPEGIAYSNTVQIDKAVIYEGGSLDIEIASVDPAWLATSAAQLSVDGTKATPPYINLYDYVDGDHHYVLAQMDQNAPQNVHIQAEVNGVEDTYIITTGNDSVQIEAFYLPGLTEGQTVELTGVPEGYYLGAPSTFTINIDE